jgi:flagellin
MKNKDFRPVTLSFSKHQTSSEPLISKVVQALEKLSNLLQLARKLSIQSANGTTEAADRRHALHTEINQIKILISEAAKNSGLKDLKSLDISVNGTNAVQPPIDFDDGDILDLLGTHQVNSAGKIRYLGNEISVEANNYLNEITTFAIDNGQNKSCIDVSQSYSVIDYALAINKQVETTNVSAYVDTEALISNLSADCTISFELRSDNNRPVTISADITKTDFTNLIRAVNIDSGITGVCAQTFGANNIVKLFNSIGKEIIISNFRHSNAISEDVDEEETMDNTLKPLAFVSIDVQQSDNNKTQLCANDNHNHLNSLIISGNLELNSHAAFNVTTNNDAPQFSSLRALRHVDITTEKGASMALTVIDSSISQIGQIQTYLDNLQQRFASKAPKLEETVNALSQDIDLINLQSSAASLPDETRSSVSQKMSYTN